MSKIINRLAIDGSHHMDWFSMPEDYNLLTVYKKDTVPSAWLYRDEPVSSSAPIERYNIQRFVKGKKWANILVFDGEPMDHAEDVMRRSIWFRYD